MDGMKQDEEDAPQLLNNRELLKVYIGRRYNDLILFSLKQMCERILPRI
jgi:hypothetical protein